MKKQKKQFSGILYTIGQSIKIAWKSLWYWLVAIVLLMLLHSGLIIFELIMQKRIIDAVSIISRDTISQVIVSILIFCFITNFKNIVMTIRYLCSCWFGPSLDKALKLKVFSKYKNIDMINYENSQFYDQLARAGSSTYAATNTVTGLFQTVSGHIGTIIGVLGYISLLKPELTIIVFLSMIPEVINHIYQGKKNFEQQQKVTPITRRTDFYNQTLTAREYLKETRIMGSEGFLKSLWLKVIRQLNNLTWKLHKKFFWGELLVSVTKYIAYSTTLVLCLYYMQRNLISLGEFSAILTSLAVLNDKLSTIIRNLGKIYNWGINGQYLYDFLNLQERSGENKKVHPTDEISLKNVSFKYDEDSRNILEDINLNIKKGEIIAIVGHNGAGKTTLQKVMLGMLMPNEGEVSYNNINIGMIDEKSIYSDTSALFQLFGKYHLTLGENVFIGESIKQRSDEKIEKCLEKSGLVLSEEKFPEKLDTILGTSFGGQDLSGGEWQQVALARAYYKDSDIIFLDEPTAAIDPLKESKMFEQFIDICRGKTAILITHRLSVVKIVNKILFMKNGKIAAVGNHNELMEACKDYKDMFEEQAKWYNR
jgi:ATP-binding cassette subfamily B protein